MKAQKIIQTLQTLRAYALEKRYEVALTYQEENSFLMRFANSAISLNTNEHLIRLTITAYSGNQRASYEMITDLNRLDEMKQGLDVAAEMAQHAQPLSYTPTVPQLASDFLDESGYDPALAEMNNQEKLDFFNQAVAGLETEQIKLSGVFSSGVTVFAQINTRSPHTQYIQNSDAYVTVVLAHSELKWEVSAEQSAWRKTDLDPAALHTRLAFLLNHYQHAPAQQIPLGSYDIVFGEAAIADMVRIMGWIGFSGGSLKRGFSFLKDENVGQKVFSEHFTLTDDPTRLETYPFRRDTSGLERRPFPLFESGVFHGFIWSQDDADEFNVQPTGHNVPHLSLRLSSGDHDIATLADLVKQPRQHPVLYVPFLHYMNVVNPSRALITASSRFGALLIQPDGSITIPYNVRLTLSLLDVFGDKVAWLSRQSAPYNVSSSYDARNPAAVIVPAFMQVNDLAISHSNTSY